MADRDNSEPLSSAEYETIGQALFEWIASYEGITDASRLDYQSLTGIGHIGFFTVPGGKYLHQDVIGGFTAQLPFQIAYKSANTKGNLNQFNAEKVVNDIAEYLENSEFPKLSGNREIYKLLMDSTTYKARSEDDGSDVYVRSGTVQYEKGL